MDDLRDRVLSGPICVVGLGYVGLTEATMIASKGFKVIGVDVSPERVKAINAGEWPLDPDEPKLPAMMTWLVREGHLRATTDYDEAVRECGAFIIAVPTPVSETHEPLTHRLFAAYEGVVMRAVDRKLIIIASTVAPGTTRQLKYESNFRLSTYEHLFAHAPERLSPGNMHHAHRVYPRVVGGTTQEATELAAAFYSELSVGVMQMTATAAEIVKTAENAYRDVQIAFAHELLWLCDDHNVDFWDVRQAINTCPARFVHYATAGVGGHCLPKDSHLLWSGGHKRGGALARVAREANKEQARYIALQIKDLVDEHVSDDINTPRVLLLGIAYKANTRDARHSPALAIADELRQCGTWMFFHDPYAPGFDGEKDWRDLAIGKDAIVFVQPHGAYLRPPWSLLKERMRSPIAIDATNLIKPPPDDWAFWQLGAPHG